MIAMIVIPTDFNPRSREGSDTNANTNIKHLHHFNPRSREGSDYNPQSKIIQML